MDSLINASEFQRIVKRNLTSDSNKNFEYYQKHFIDSCCQLIGNALILLNCENDILNINKMFYIHSQIYLNFKIHEKNDESFGNYLNNSIIKSKLLSPNINLIDLDDKIENLSEDFINFWKEFYINNYILFTSEENKLVHKFRKHFNYLIQLFDQKEKFEIMFECLEEFKMFLENFEKYCCDNFLTKKNSKNNFIFNKNLKIHDFYFLSNINDNNDYQNFDYEKYNNQEGKPG